jgi:uncharacterized lipoprotein YbaY
MRVILLLAALALSACGDSHEAAATKPPMPASETVFAPTLSTLDKAKSVQGTLQQGQDNADAALKAAE